MLQCILCVTQDDSSSSVAQRCPQIGHPWTRFPGQPKPQRSGLHWVRRSWRKQNGMTCSFRLLKSKGETWEDHSAGRVEGLEGPKLPIGEKLAGRKPLQESAGEMCDWEDKPLTHSLIHSTTIYSAPTMFCSLL